MRRAGPLQPAAYRHKLFPAKRCGSGWKCCARQAGEPNERLSAIFARVLRDHRGAHALVREGPEAHGGGARGGDDAGVPCGSKSSASVLKYSWVSASSKS